jgi:hypothetical protein
MLNLKIMYIQYDADHTIPDSLSRTRERESWEVRSYFTCARNISLIIYIDAQSFKWVIPTCKATKMHLKIKIVNVKRNVLNTNIPDGLAFLS